MEEPQIYLFHAGSPHTRHTLLGDRDSELGVEDEVSELSSCSAPNRESGECLML